MIKHQIGSVMQVAYLVQDLDSSIEEWLGLGIGPFFVSRHAKYKNQVYRGKTIESDFSIALAYSGEMQIEIVQTHCNSVSAFEDFKKDHGFGLHHVGILSNDISVDIKALEKLGYALIQRMTSVLDIETAYIASPNQAGAVLELIQRSPTLDAGFEMMKQITQAWDGRGPAVHEF